MINTYNLLNLLGEKGVWLVSHERLFFTWWPFGKIWSAPNFKKSTPNKNLERSKFSHAIGHQINGIDDTTNNGPFWSTIDVYR